jgi:TonB family protein
MPLDRSLTIALLISLFFHLTIFLPFPHLKKTKIEKEAVILKTTYLMPKKNVSQTTDIKQRAKTKVIKQAKTKIIKAKTTANSQDKVKIVKLNDKFEKKIMKATSTGNTETKIKIPADLPKEQKQLYLNYYQSIREKIRKFVEKNYSHFIARGEVHLYFVLLSNGDIEEIKIIQEKSTGNRLLKNIAKRSIQQAAPFSHFPEKLKQSQLSFNVIISFELED